MSKEEGKAEMTKLRQREQEYEASSAPGQRDPGTADASRAELSAQGLRKESEQMLAEVRLRMQRIKVKVAEGRMSEEEGKAEMAKLKLKEKELELSGSSSPQATEKTAVASAHSPRDAGDVSAPDEARKRLAEVRARMQRVKAMVTEGKLDKEEAKVKLTRLKQKEEALERAGGPATKEKRAATYEPADVRSPIRPEGSADAPAAENPEITLAEFEEQIQRINRKVKEGSVEAEKGKAKLMELASLKQRLSDAGPEGGHDKGSRKPSAAEREQLGLALQEQMAKVKQRVRDRKWDKEEGRAALSKLTEKLKKLNSEPARPAEAPSSPSSRQTNGPSPIPHPALEALQSKTAKLEGKLEDNKRKIVHLQKKVASATSTDRLAIEKALKDLEVERKRLKTALSALKTSTTANGPHEAEPSREVHGATTEPSTEAPNEGQEELDPDILREVLAAELPTAAPASLAEALSPETFGALAPHSPRQALDVPLAERDTKLPSPRNVPGSYPRTQQSAKLSLDEATDAVTPRSAPVPQVPFPVAYPTHIPKASRGVPLPGTEVDHDSLAPPLIATGARDAPVARRGVGAESRDQGMSGHTPELGHALAVADATWSTCLVSLAECINLANYLLTQLAVKHELASTRDGDQTSLFEQLIPRLLTAVLLQQDLDGVLRRVLGDDAAQPIQDFMRHLRQVRAYLSSIDVASLKSTPTERSGDGEPDRGSNSTEEHGPDTAGGAHGVFAVTDQLLRLSQYLAPEMMSALRVLLHGWKEDGLTVHNILRTIRFIKNDLVVSPSRAEQANAAVKGESKASLLHQLLELLDTDATPPEQRDPRRKAHRRSLTAPPPDGLQPKPPSAPPDAPHGVRKRLSSMAHTLRTAPTPPTRASATVPLNINHSTKASEAPARRQSATTDAADVAPAHGLTILTESLSPTSKKRVARHLSHPSEVEVEHTDRHPHQPAPNLHLPPTTADFLEAPLRSTTPSTPPGHRGDFTDASADPTDGLSESDAIRTSVSTDASQWEPHAHRPRTWSSDSAYSVDSAATDGTIDSDEEARLLLAHADSGP